MNPQVSIMLPVFNGMPLLKASIESILRQTYTNWQCIICDDGSTDGTWEYLQDLLKEETTNHCDSNIEPRFILLKNDTNRGRGYSRQRILEASTGTYICMLDAGDLMHPERIRLQVDYLQSHPDVGLVSTAMISFGLHTDRLIYRGLGDGGLHTFDGVNFPCFAPSMFRNPQVDTCRFHEQMNFSEDQYFLTGYFRQQPTFYSMPDALYYYSEFDSVTKSKIRLSYLQNIRIYHHQHMPLVALTFLLKYLYSILIFPFLDTEDIVARRGTPATPEERDRFNLYGRTLLYI